MARDRAQRPPCDLRVSAGCVTFPPCKARSRTHSLRTMIVVRPAPLARHEKPFGLYSAREPGTREPSLTTLVSIRKGHDVRYFTNAGGVGCAGAMAYYTRGGEPAGQWEGKAAARLGLAGQVDPGILDRLFMENIAPTGEVLA